MMPNELQRCLGRGMMPRLGETLEVLRGVELLPQDEAIEWTHRFYADDPSPFQLALLKLPHEARFHHRMFMCSFGSGKTTLILQQLKEDLELVAQGLVRLFAWDLQGVMRRHLEPYRGDVRIDYVNPIFEHGVGIHVAKDVNTPWAIEQFVNDMISPRAEAGRSANMEWVEAARSILAEVVKIFQQNAPDGEWRLIDVIEACSTIENLEQVLSQTRHGRSLLRGILGTKNQTSGVLFNLQGSARSMRTLAAAMVHSRNISIRDWATGPGSVLVLQHHHAYPKALEGFERWVFGQVVNHAISGATKGSTTILYLDEVRHGPFESHFMKVATAGRGKGVGIVAGLTDFSGLIDQMNDHQAEEVLGSFSTQVLFMNNNPKTAKLVSDRLGSNTALVPEASASVTRSPDGTEEEFREKRSKYLYPSLHQDDITVRAVTSTDKPYNYVTKKFEGPRGFATPEEVELWERHRITPASINAERPVPKSQTLNLTFKETERLVATTTEMMNLPQAAVLDEKGLTVVAYVVSAFVGKPTLIAVSGMNHPDVTLIPPRKRTSCRTWSDRPSSSISPVRARRTRSG